MNAGPSRLAGLPSRGHEAAAVSESTPAAIMCAMGASCSHYRAALESRLRHTERHVWDLVDCPIVRT